jgi:hypothetical protein
MKEDNSGYRREERYGVLPEHRQIAQQRNGERRDPSDCSDLYN